MKNVFIFGAGTSTDAGGPVMSNFLDKAEELFFASNSNVDKDAFRDVLEARAELQSIYAKAYLDLDNFETLFGAIELASITGKFGSRTPKEITKLRDSMITLIVETLERTILFPYIVETPGMRGILNAPTPYDAFEKMIASVINQNELNSRQAEFSIITFNYDIALDYALFGKHVPFTYCLSEENSINKIPLLKLHGSMHWGINPNTQNVISQDLSEIMQFTPVSTTKVQIIVRDTLKKQGLEPLIVPPTWNKLGYQSLIAPVWKKAAEVLSEAENIFVIGYSLPATDSFFRYLYALGSDSNTTIKRFWVYNPEPSVEKRFSEMVGRGVEKRFKFLSETFRYAIADIQSALNEVYHIS